MKKNAYPRILNTIISISFILCAFLGSVHFWCFHEPFYDSEHAKIRLYDKSIAEHIGISEDDLKELTSFTLHYLNDPKADLDIQMQIKGQLREVYTEDEKAHMVDVRNLNLAANRILLAAAAVLILNLVTFIFVK